MRIAEMILLQLPEWFGIPESTAQYIRTCGEMPLWADFDGECCRGFIAMKQTSDCAAELHVMGVVPEFHGRGIGRRLFEAMRRGAGEMGLTYLHVKTVRMGVYENYDRTNRFYLAMGFRELECIPDLWDEANPCQIYIMTI